MSDKKTTRHFNAATYFIDRHIEKGRGEKTAILFEDDEYSYRDVSIQVGKTAAMLQNLGVRMENRVMLLMRDMPEMIFSFYGAIRIGAVPIPTNIFLKADDFLFILNDSRARVLIVDALFAPAIRKIRKQAGYLEHVVVIGDMKDAGHGELLYQDLVTKVEPNITPADTTPDDAAFWLYSARFPDVMMAAVHHHSHLLFCAEAYAGNVLGLNENDRIMGSFLFFAYGLGNSVCFPFFAGATTILSRERPLPERVYQDLVRYRPTLFFSVPTLLGALADYKAKCRKEGIELPPVDSLRACISSAEFLSPEIYHHFKKEFGVDVLDGTGSTEACHIFISNRLKDVHPGSCGYAVPGFRTRIVDDDGNPVPKGEIGNLQVSGGSIASAYWNRRDETKRNMLGEWFVTGDRYRIDENGLHYYHGRSDDMLRIGGRWVSPVDVESILNTHPAVAESAVTGLQADDGLTVLTANIVLRTGFLPSDKLIDEIRTYIKEKTAPYKAPRKFFFVHGIPKTEGGRIQRFLLKEKDR